jgi:hypothetical protein
VPIFEPVMQAVWANVAPRTALAPPSPDLKRQLACKSVDLDSGEAMGGPAGPAGTGKMITECFRIDRNGQVLDTQYQLVSREQAYSERDAQGYYGVAPNPFSSFFGGFEQRPSPYNYGNNGRYYQDNNGRYYYHENGRYVPVPSQSARPSGQYFGQSGQYARDPRYQAPPPRDPYGREYQTPQRIDPGYLWGNRRY